MSDTIYYLNTNNGNDIPVPASEFGGGGCFYIETYNSSVDPSYNTFELDCSWNEIKAAIEAGKHVVLKLISEIIGDIGDPIGTDTQVVELSEIGCDVQVPSYYVIGEGMRFEADAADGYPFYTDAPIQE